MSKHENFEAGKEARRQLLTESGHVSGVGSHLDAVVRYLKGAGAGSGDPVGGKKPLDSHEIRRLVVDRVIDAGGETAAVVVSGGSVLVRGRVGCRSEIAILDRELRSIPGVSRLELHLGYDIDDTGGIP